MPFANALEPRTRYRILAVVTAGMLTLASCGGGSGSTAADDSKASPAPTTASNTGDDDGDADDGAVKTGEANALLPIDADVPAGFRSASDHCRAEPGTQDPDGTYRTWIGYAVPEDWRNTGFSGGGSGGARDSDTLKFDPTGEEGPQRTFEVGVDWDSTMPDGTILGTDGEPFESFDYEITYMGDDERTIAITYDEVGTVQIGDQTVDLHYRDPAQDEDELGTRVQYKARIDAYEMPKARNTLDVLVPESFVVTIDFDNDDVDVTHDEVEEILGSFMLPQCTWDKIIGDGELMLGVDLDGDGNVRDASDVQDELDDMMDELPPEVREQYDAMREDTDASGD